jgi:cytochrome c oxidase assembly protein subunit 15
MLIITLVCLNLLSGAMVAGIEGGKVYNTWPDMNGGFIPGSYMCKGISSVFEDRGTV